MIPKPIRRLFICAALICGAPFATQAEPANKTLAAYEAAKDRALRRAEQRAEQEYKERIDEVNALSNPGRLNEDITIRLVRSGPPVVSGTLYDVQAGRESYARIGDRKVNLADVSEIDQQRVLMALKTQKEIDRELAAKRGELEAAIQRRVELLTRINLEDAGYTPAFLQQAIQLGDRFYMPADLGDGRGYLSVRALPKREDPYNSAFNMKMSNPLQTPGLAILMVDGEAIYATFPETGEPVLRLANWPTVTFNTARALMDPEPIRMVPQLARLVIYSKDLGKWTLVPKPVRQRTSEFDLANFVWSLDVSSIEPYTEDMDTEFAMRVEAARNSMKEIRTRLEADLVRFAEEERNKPAEPVAPAEPEEVVDTQAATSEELIAKRQAIYQRMKPVFELWHTHQQPPEEVLQFAQYLVANDVVGNPNSPMTVDKFRVIRFSPWQNNTKILKDEERGLAFIGVKYRFLELTPHQETGEPRFLLHAVTLVENKANEVVLARPQITFPFKKKDSYDWVKPGDWSLQMRQQFNVMPSWWGYLGMYRRVPIELVAAGMDQKAINIESLAPIEGEKTVEQPVMDEPVAADGDPDTGE